MKKLLIAAAIVCAAAVSQAANVKWTTPKLYAGDSAGDFTATALKDATGISGVSVALVFYAFDAGSESWKPIDGVSNASSSKFAKSGSISATTADYDFLMSTEYKYSAHYEYTDAAGALYTMDVGQTSFTPDKGTGDYTLNIVGAGKWTVQGVPEPTSGLLLLLGVAGLALRRRRA